MLKVNLEKELIKQNKSLVSARELLLIKEYEVLGKETTNEETLARVFGSIAAKEGQKVVDRVNSLLEETKKFNQERVFHISQIAKLCKKYDLKFLPSGYYTGTIDKELPNKISQFEIANDVLCECKEIQVDTPSEWIPKYKSNTFIAAPQESFDLEAWPKDPLFFYKINNEYYYLIHKWGNDLSILRRAYVAVFGDRFAWFVVSAMIFIISTFGLLITGGKWFLAGMLVTVLLWKIIDAAGGLGDASKYNEPFRN